MTIRVPASFPITMTQIWAAVNDHTSTSAKALGACYANSIFGYFDPAYSVSAQTMGRFRNYGPPSAPPTYNLHTTYGADNIIVNINECNINKWEINTFNVPDGTIFRIECTTDKFLTHYTFRDSSGTLHSNTNYIDLTISSGYAYCNVEMIVDRVVESTDGINFMAFVPTYSPYHPANSPVWSRSYSLSDVVPSYLFEICGTWGPVANSTNLECQIYSSNCDKLKQVDKLRLYRHYDISNTTVMIKEWSYSEVDNGSSINILNFTEYGDPFIPDAIKDGFRYTYKLVATDIFGNAHPSADKLVACRTYINTKLTYYSVYSTGFPSRWKADMTLNVTTNIQYAKTGAIDAYLYGQSPSQNSHHLFSANSPEYGYDHYDNNQSAYSAFNGAAMGFSVSGGMFNADCGEQVSVDLPQGYTEPINY